VVATGGKPWQMPQARTGQKQAKTVAVGCNQLPRRLDGKEGVSGSSPEEGSAKAPEIGALLLNRLRSLLYAAGDRARYKRHRSDT